MADVIDIADARFLKDIERVHRGGPRLLAEMLSEIGARRMLRSEIEAVVRRFARLSPAFLAAIGADPVPPADIIDDLRFALRRIDGILAAEDRPDVFEHLRDAAVAIEAAIAKAERAA